MRLALISDVHANLTALEAVASALDEEQPDLILFLGDALGMGPHPNEVLARLNDLCDVFVMGNADAEALDPVVPEGASDDLRRFIEISAWTGTRLSPAERTFVESFRERAEIEVGGLRLVAYHGSPRSFDEVIGPETPAAELDELLGTARGGIYAGGHTHFQFVRRHRDALLVNPGSAGLAYDRTHPEDEIMAAKVAEFALLESDGEDLTVALRRIPFDVARHVAALRAADMPHAEWLASGYRLG